MNEIISVINQLLPLSIFALSWIIVPLYKNIKNQQEEIILLKRTIILQNEEIALLREIVFDIADATKLKQHLINRPKFHK